MNAMERILLNQKVAAAFTPSAPIDNSALFAGRTTQITKLLNAITQKGQHAILYGERGVGKTSLANVMKDILKAFVKTANAESYWIGSTNCEGASTFESIWTALLRDVKTQSAKPVAGFSQLVEAKTGTLLDFCPSPKNSEDIRQFLEQLPQSSVFVIDEFDQMKKNTARKAIADTIKSLSDRAVNSTIIILGVADSVGELLAEHISIERALVQIPMQRMSSDELKEIIDKGMKAAGMAIEDDAKIKIAHLSQGLPHYTHLLALHAAQSAVSSDRFLVGSSDVDSALKVAVEQAQQSIVTGYVTATTSRRGNLYSQVLTACAMSPKDELGYFSSSDVREPMSKIMGRPYEIPAFSQHLNEFCTKERNNILKRIGYPRRYRYRFTNPLMEPYVIMKGMTKGFIKDEVPSKPNP